MLGEPVPLAVTDVRLVAENGTGTTYEDLGGGVIAFPRGNYSVSYTAGIRDTSLQQTFERPYSVNVTVPAGFNVTNPILGGYSPGANVTALADGSTVLSWPSTREVRVRFYDAGREELLWFFATTWAVVAIVLLFPFVADRLFRPRR